MSVSPGQGQAGCSWRLIQPDTAGQNRPGESLNNERKAQDMAKKKESERKPTPKKTPPKPKKQEEE